MLWQVSRHCLILFGCSVFKAYLFSLVVEVYSGAILPLGLQSDQTRRYQGSLDALVIEYHHFYDGPNPDIPTCLGVGLPSLCGEAAGQALQCGLRFCAHHAVDRDEER